MPDPTPFRVALWQGPSPAGDAQAGLMSLAPALRAAGAAGAKLLVAPECYLPGYNSDRLAALAQPRGGDWHRAAAMLCREAGCALILGYAERDGGKVYNSAVVMGPDGAELAHYRKIQLYGPREAAFYHPGERYCTVEIAGRLAGILICYDVEFAPHVATLAAAGCEMLLVPTANMLPFTHVAEATVPAMAANHGLSILYANLCGREGDLTYAGGSVICGPHGEVLARAGQGPALLIADLPPPDPDRLSTQRQDLVAVPPPEPKPV